MMRRISVFAILLVGAMLLCGCKDEDILTTQQQSIVRYLTSTRGMIAEAEVADAAVEEPDFYSETGDTAYRYIYNYYDADRSSRTEVEAGDRVSLTFDAYVFSYQNPTTTSVYWSNKSTTISALVAASGNTYATIVWSTDPLDVTLNDGEIIKGVNDALIGCREQDSVQVFMTYRMAYGKKLIGTVDKNSPVAWYLKINSVTKAN